MTSLRRIEAVRNLTDLFDSKWFNFVGNPQMDRVQVDIIERATEYEVRAVVPGVPKDGIIVKVDGDELRIIVSADEASEESDRYLFKGIRSVNFSRVIPNLASYNIVTDKIKSVYKDGILSIAMPKAEEAQPKIIDIQVE